MDSSKANTKSAFPRNGSTGCRKPFRRRGGFTLVEVTVALGIVAVAMTGLIGVIPAGLNAAHDAAQQTAYSHILMQISSDLGMLPYSEVDSYVGETQYCDYDGRRVDTASKGIYQVSLSTLDSNYPQPLKLENLDKHIKRVVVGIRRVGEPLTKAKRTTLTVANTGL